MSINFAAANMAGYNNPKIEVFSAISSEAGDSLAQYPSKSEILNCLSRGSVPVIMLRYDTSRYLLLLSDWDNSEAGAVINFFTPGGTSSSTKIGIIYPENGSKPVLIIE